MASKAIPDSKLFPKSSWWAIPMCRFITWLAACLIYRMRWRGVHNVPKEGPFILASNHQSYLDPPLMGVAPRHRAFRYMSKETYFRIPIASWVMFHTNTFPIDRAARFDRRAYQLCLDTLKQGLGLILFPEGTRTRDGRLGVLQPGVARMALLTGAAVVPVGLTGAYEAWPHGSRRPHLSAITLKYYRPIMVEKCEKPSELGERSQELTEKLRKILDRRVRAYWRWKERKAKPTHAANATAGQRYAK